MKTIIALLIWPLALAGFILSGMIFIVAITVIPRHYLHHVVRVLCRFILLCSGQILVVNRNDFNDDAGPYIFMFNHATMFDPFIIGAVVRHYVTAVGADYQFSYPLWGAMLRKYGITPIIRSDLKSAIASLGLAEAAIRDGVSFLISPEGTRTITGELLPFKKGPFHVTKNTGATIVPLAFFNSLRAKPKNDWRIRPGIIRVQFGQPLTADDYRYISVEELRDLTRDKLLALLREK